MRCKQNAASQRNDATSNKELNKDPTIVELAQPLLLANFSRSVLFTFISCSFYNTSSKITSKSRGSPNVWWMNKEFTCKRESHDQKGG